MVHHHLTVPLDRGLRVGARPLPGCGPAFNLLEADPAALELDQRPP